MLAEKAERRSTAVPWHEKVLGRGPAAWIAAALLVASAVLYAMHFLHLNADFPNGSPWVDWSKYTDEGWYGDAAIRHYLTGHWYWKGDFNPAVALPVWPAVEWVVFAVTGVSPAAARATTLVVFGLTLAVFYLLLRRFTREDELGPSLAPALCVFIMCASPFFFVFERMAILEPLLILLTALALLVAASLQANARSRWALSIALGVLLPAMVLTKTTGVFLFPAIAWMIWVRAGYKLMPALKLAALPAALGAALWLGYFLGFVRPHYLEDYRYLFSANAYTGILLAPFEQVVMNTFTDGKYMGALLYAAFYGVLALGLFWRPRLFRNPLVPALLLWAGGYVVFLAYHNNLQPRYYLVVAAPITALVAIGFDEFRRAASRRRELIGTAVVVALTVGITLPGLVYEIDIATHPSYTFEHAAQAIKQIVTHTPGHSHLILSISGSDITLMTGLPSIDDDFGTWDLDVRAKRYQPGWYVAWNELDDDKMDALTPTFHVTRVAAFPAMDDPDRNLLILYRLDAAGKAAAKPRFAHKRKPTPKPLVTKMGEQPTTEQLQH